MGKLIYFSTSLPFSEDSMLGVGLEKLLARSSKLAKKSRDAEVSKVANLKNKEEARLFLEGIILEEILKRKNISEEYFLCSNYISYLLTSFFQDFPEFWTVIDYEKLYYEKGDSEYLKKGANVCFLINAIFRGRGHWRLMKPSFYTEKGKALYYQFYLEKERLVGYHMSVNFEEMAEVTRIALS